MIPMILEAAAVTVSAVAVITQSLALRRLLNARSHASQAFSKLDAGVREAMLEKLRSGSPVEVQKGLDEFQHELSKIAPSDAPVIQHSIGNESKENKARFVERLVAGGSESQVAAAGH